MTFTIWINSPRKFITPLQQKNYFPAFVVLSTFCWKISPFQWFFPHLLHFQLDTSSVCFPFKPQSCLLLTPWQDFPLVPTTSLMWALTLAGFLLTYPWTCSECLMGHYYINWSFSDSFRSWISITILLLIFSSLASTKCLLAFGGREYISIFEPSGGIMHVPDKH